MTSQPAAGPVLVTGASGLLGGWLLRTASTDADVVAVVHRTPVAGVSTISADLRSSTEVTAALAAVRPSVVVHAAYALDEASIVDATRIVAHAAAAAGAQTLLVSTDAVFRGDGVPRSEAELADPIWDYGRWKVAAERAVLGRTGGSVVRLPLLVSVDPDDHVVARIRAASASGEVLPWFGDEIRRPALASEVAAAIWRIAGLSPEARQGVWHLAGPERLSRLDIARRVVDRLSLDPACIEASTTPDGLVRPRDLEFTDQRARRAIGWDPSPVLA